MIYLKPLRVGIDIGSTTIKVVVIDQQCHIIYKTYERHMSSINAAVSVLFKRLKETFGLQTMVFNFTGSAGFGLAKKIGAKFTQEVIAATQAIRFHRDNIDVCIELGGEDAKIIFFDGLNIEQRMNGTCAGGTGAFIDQMASLLNTDARGINTLAKEHQQIYDIASRCGVFAKTDIQPLLNQGARIEDIAVSVYQAIVNQTIGGLSQGRKITGSVAFLGGPLTFSDQLRERFIKTLKLNDVFVPQNGEVFVAFGAALEAKDLVFDVDTMIERIIQYQLEYGHESHNRKQPLFSSEKAYTLFKERHSQNKLNEVKITDYHGKAYLGIDAGSTTSKMVLIGENQELLYSFYAHNHGNPVQIIKQALEDLYINLHAGITIHSAYSTGYGETLLKHAFALDGSEVETICHYHAAKHFKPDVDFVIDIGGQDMKCFTIKNGVITAIILNEACSSGCGSFIETFAESLGYSIEKFSQLAIGAKAPVDLGSRCTVFMNSSVKQAQSEAALPEDISAGLAISVVKNALYKVIRAHDIKAEYGHNILVQGGTFNNDAVLRAFELETEVEVVRPPIAGLMGAFGAALLAQNSKQNTVKSQMVGIPELENFSYRTKRAVCKQCLNYCPLTVNIFSDNTRYISGNRCERGAGNNQSFEHLPNLYLYKYDKILSYQSNPNHKYALTVGLPLVLNMYENIPFWQPFFDAIDIRVVYSDRSNKVLYETGQDSIPSDTICYPAKLVHGHIESLVLKKPDFIFFPNMPYNFLEKDHGDNHYNCPIVAHYPEVIDANMDHLNLSSFLKPYVTLNDKKKFIDSILHALSPYTRVTKKMLNLAFEIGMKSYFDFRKDVQLEGEKALEYVIENNLNAFVLAGRPYHIDPEINHGIPRLIRSLNVVVLSEDSINHLANQDAVNVLNQWTYHTRLYDSAKAIIPYKNISYVHLVSFGCGLDAITSDEIKDILESNGKLYTQLKIDEISNLGAVNIRLRSLIATRAKEDR